MATAGLSLIGFSDDPNQALQFLRQICVPSIDTDTALLSEWVAAKGKLGGAIPDAGKPEVLPIPPAHDEYIAALKALPVLQNLLSGPLAGSTFQLVEINKLLAYQIMIDQVRSRHHCGKLSQPPSLEQLLTICLPIEAPSDSMQILQQQQSVIVKSRGLNLSVIAQGFFGGFAGLQFGFALPFAHVVRHNGRCYLHNGFHRTYGAALAGATHIPCLFRDVHDHNNVGIRTDGSTFSAAILESTNPPTLAHYVLERAHPVQVRAFSRILHVSWSEYSMPDE